MREYRTAGLCPPLSRRAGTEAIADEQDALSGRSWCSRQLALSTNDDPDSLALLAYGQPLACKAS